MEDVPQALFRKDQISDCIARRACKYKSSECLESSLAVVVVLGDALVLLAQSVTKEWGLLHCRKQAIPLRRRRGRRLSPMHSPGKGHHPFDIAPRDERCRIEHLYRANESGREPPRLNGEVNAEDVGSVLEVAHCGVGEAHCRAVRAVPGRRSRRARDRPGG